MVIKRKLSNGLEVIAIPHRVAPVVSIQGWIRFGAADESSDIAGIAHLFEHLLFKGTHRRKVGQIAQEVEGLGGDLNAYTSYDHTVMHLTLRSKDLNQGLDILSDALKDSIVSEEELANERPVILEEIKRYKDMPGSVAGELLREELFKGHPYSRPVIGYDHIVAAMTRDKIMEVYKRYYNSKNVFLVVCGDFEEESLMKVCEKYFGDMQSGPIPVSRPSLESVRKTAIRFKPHPCPDVIAQLGWQTPSLLHPDTPALDALALILGQGESSRLYKEIVLEKNWMRSLDAGCWSPKDLGCFAISMKGPAGSSKHLSQILERIQKIMALPFTKEELRKAKNNLLSSVVYSKETVDGLAQRFAYYESLCGDWKEDQIYLDRVQAINLEDLERVRDHYLSWDTAVLAGVVPEKEKLPKISFPAPVKEKPKKVLPSSEVQAFDFKGLRILLRTQSQLPVLSLRWVGMGGSHLLKADQWGLGSMWARSVTNGCVRADGKVQSRDEVSEEIDASCAGLSAFHGRNSYGYQLDCMSHDFEKLFDLLCSIKKSPTFVDKDIALEKKHQLADLKSSEDSPSYVAGRLFSQGMFEKHSYAWPALGTPQSVKKIHSRDLKKYHQKLESQPQVLCVVGDLSKEQLIKMLEKNSVRGSSQKLSAAQKKLKSKKMWPGPKKFVEFRKILKKEQSHIILGFPSCRIYDKEQLALSGLSALLSGQGGRLFIELRDKLSLCYTVSPTHLEGIEGGYFGFYIACSPEKEKASLEAMYKEMDRLMDEEISEEEWQRSQQFYLGNHLIEQQRFSYQAMGMVLDELYGLGYKNYLNFETYFSGLSSKDVLKAAKKYLGKEARKRGVLAVVGPR